MEYKRCIGCGAYFTPTNDKQRYCTPLCRERTKVKRAAQRDSEKDPVYQKTCAQCGKKFQTRRSRQKFCSKACALKQPHRSQQEAIAIALAKSAAFDGQEIKNGTRRICRICGKEYTVDEAHGAWRYCSMFCAREALDWARVRANKVIRELKGG